MPDLLQPSRGVWRHAAAVAASFTLFFGWLYARPLIEGSFLAEADLFDFYLPVFLSPMTAWGSYEFAGAPEFANPQTSTFYPLHLITARLIGGSLGWTLFLLSAAVLAASLAYAYVYAHTRSKLAATVAGLTFGLSEAVMERIAHPTILHGAVWLPLIALAIDSLRRRPRPGWIAAGAWGVGCLILAGHPQMWVYVGYAALLYAAAVALIERPPAGFYGGVAAMFVLGALLASVIVLPLLEASLQMARGEVNFGAFISRGNSPWQMLSAFFPRIDHEGRDAPTYAGLVPLMLATVAVIGLRRCWRAAFWLAVIALCVPLGMGDATPLTGWAFDLPLYDRFRVSARHLILVAFAVSALAGFGLSLIQQRQVTPRLTAAGALIVATCLAVAAVLLLRTPAAVTFSPVHTWLPSADPGIWQQVVIVLVGVWATVAFAMRPSSRWRGAAVVTLVIGDLLQALPYGVDAKGLVDALRIAEGDVQPGVHAQRLKDELGTQRLLLPDGTTDGVVTGAFARLWELPTAGGNNTMLLRSHAELAAMGTNGSVSAHTLDDSSAALDVLAVRYVVVPASTLAPARPLDMIVGPRECGQSYPRTASFHLPRDVEVAQVAVLAHLGCGNDVIQGTTVGTIRLAAADGTIRWEQAIRAGIDIGEESLGDPQAAARSRHQAPAGAVARDGGRLSYLLRVTPPEPVSGAVLTIEVGASGWLGLDGVTLTDTAGRSRALSDRELMLLYSPRWRTVTRFATSRLSDRGSDEDVAGEAEYVVFENQRALPRAWLASEVIPLAPAKMRIALHDSYLPDGRVFDPRRMALVEPGSIAAVSRGQAAGTVTLRAVRAGRFEAAVSSPEGGLLVLSESRYPGWRATIDGQPVPLYAVDISLQGVDVPPGDHVVIFEFASPTLRAGLAGSGLAALIIGGLLIGARLRRAAARQAGQSARR